MRLATWNCCAGPIARKLAAIERLGADVVVVPECPKISDDSPNTCWFGTNSKKGVGVFSRAGFDLRPLTIEPALPRYVIPIQVGGSHPFLLLAVWAQNDGADRYVRGVVRAVDTCAQIITAQPTVALGDFNSNTTWDDEHPTDRNHSALVKRLDGLGLVSAYHAFYDENHGVETRPTFFEYRHEHRPHHIDFCFVPRTWRRAFRNVVVGEFSDWSTLSDHMPLSLDVDEQAV